MFVQQSFVINVLSISALLLLSSPLAMGFPLDASANAPDLAQIERRTNVRLV